MSDYSIKLSQFKISGERIKLLRKEKELGMQMLAKKLGVTCSTIAAWEENRSIPKLKNYIILSKYFSVSVDYLAGLTSERKRKSNRYNK